MMKTPMGKTGGSVESISHGFGYALTRFKGIVETLLVVFIWKYRRGKRPRTADGALVITYMPTARAVTVDMSRLAAPATARWFDPTTGAYAPIAGSPFANAGMRTFTPAATKHGDGFDDWILLLETTPVP